MLLLVVVVFVLVFVVMLVLVLLVVVLLVVLLLLLFCLALLWGALAGVHFLRGCVEQGVPDQNGEHIAMHTVLGCLGFQCF